jgi:glycosyltransferase involved in cell wall biosynthesis
MKIINPIAYGKGAGIVHKMLETGIKGYQMMPYNPYLTLFPPILYFIGRSEPADLIHTTADYAIYHRRSVPTILTFHGYVLDSYMDQYNSLLQKIHYRTNLKFQNRWAIRRADKITAVSHYIANLVKQELTPEQEVKVIYNGVDETLFRPVESELVRPSNEIKVLVSGHLSRKKGSQWVNQIVERLDENISVHYTTGLNSKQQYLDHPRLHSLGSIPHGDMPAIYQQHDILLFPTVREGFGLVAAEAMSCGIPVVATDCSALPELVIDGKGGYLCELGNVNEFASRINQLARDRSRRKKMGEFNRARIEEKFTMQKMITEYQQLFEEVLS